MQCAGDDWEKRKSNQPTDSQLMGRKRRAGDRFAPSSYEEEVVRQTEHRWDTPHKRALFGSDEPRISDFRVMVMPWEISPGCSLRIILPK